MSISKRLVTEVLNRAGVVVNGTNPWDIVVRDERFYERVVKGGSLALGESYMDGWWDCLHLDQFIERTIRAGSPWFVRFNPKTIWLLVRSRVFNLAPKEKAFLVGEQHYDLGNGLYEKMLDPEMTYSCGYYAGLPETKEQLHAAQVAKIDLICRKMGLRPGHRVLEIGCGWGGFAYHAARHYGAEVVGLTVSKEQAHLAREKCAGLPVEVRLQDYRDVQGQFDRIVSVGMFEHVEPRNHRTYMEVAKRCLKPGGLFLLHTIGARRIHSPDPWIRRYIFPVGQVPTHRQIESSARGLLEILDFHQFGRYYDPTLVSWHDRFVAAWPELEAEYGHLFDGKFFRMWQYYLLMCAGSFRAGHVDLFQVVLSHPDEHHNYNQVR